MYQVSNIFPKRFKLFSTIYLLFSVVSLVVLSTFNVKAQDFEIVDFNSLPNKYLEQNKVRKDNVYSYVVDDKGHITDSTLTQVCLYVYNAHGKMTGVEMKDNQFEKSFGFHSIIVYAYNNQDQVIKELHYDVKDSKTASLSFGREFGYDALNRHQSTFNYNKDTTTLNTLKKTYDEKNKLIEVRQNFNNGSFALRNRLYYSAKGRLQKIQFFKDIEKLDYTYVFEYDASTGARIISIDLENKGNSIFENKVYNDQGQEINVTSYGTKGFGDNAQKLEVVRKYTYNPDHTLYSQITENDGVIRSMTRHYYTK